MFAQMQSVMQVLQVRFFCTRYTIPRKIGRQKTIFNIKSVEWTDDPCFLQPYMEHKIHKIQKTSIHLVNNCYGVFSYQKKL